MLRLHIRVVGQGSEGDTSFNALLPAGGPVRPTLVLTPRSTSRDHSPPLAPAPATHYYVLVPVGSVNAVTSVARLLRHGAHQGFSAQQIERSEGQIVRTLNAMNRGVWPALPAGTLDSPLEDLSMREEAPSVGQARRPEHHPPPLAATLPRPTSGRLPRRHGRRVDDRDIRSHDSRTARTSHFNRRGDRPPRCPGDSARGESRFTNRGCGTPPTPGGDTPMHDRRPAHERSVDARRAAGSKLEPTTTTPGTCAAPTGRRARARDKSHDVYADTHRRARDKSLDVPYAHGQHAQKPPLSRDGPGLPPHDFSDKVFPSSLLRMVLVTRG